MAVSKGFVFFAEEDLSSEVAFAVGEIASATSAVCDAEVSGSLGALGATFGPLALHASSMTYAEAAGASGTPRAFGDRAATTSAMLDAKRRRVGSALCASCAFWEDAEPPAAMRNAKLRAALREPTTTARPRAEPGLKKL